MLHKVMSAALCAVVLLGLGALGGCSNKVTASSVRSDMTPELQSVALNHEQRENAHAHTLDTNGREIWDDLDQILFLDRPMQLTRYPIP